MREGWLEHGKVRLHYLEWPGSDRGESPPILFLHGLSSNARFWERVARHLGSRHLVALDQRCHGLSDQPAYGYSNRTLAGDVAETIRALRLGRPVVAGHSWGASIALETAVRYPGLVSGLVQLDGGTISFADLMSWDLAMQVMHRPMPTYATIEEAVSERRAELPGAWDDDLVAFVESGLRPARGGYRLSLTMPARRQTLRGMYDQQPEGLWPLLGVPILAGFGNSADVGGDFLSIKRRSAERLQAVRPAAEVRWYDGPHDFPLYVPEVVAADIESFIG